MRQPVILQPITCRCVQCGKEVYAKVAGFDPEKLKEYLLNYHCPEHRVVSEDELLAMEVEGLQ